MSMVFRGLGLNGLGSMSILRFDCPCSVFPGSIERLVAASLAWVDSLSAVHLQYCRGSVWFESPKPSTHPREP